MNSGEKEQDQYRVAEAGCGMVYRRFRKAKDAAYPFPDFGGRGAPLSLAEAQPLRTRVV